MIEEVTRYKVRGHREFATREAAERHVRWLELVAECDSKLNNKGKLDSNGRNYRCQTSKEIRDFLEAVYEMFLKMGEQKYADLWLENPRGILGRYMDDSNHPALSCYYRYACIDSLGREWGQQYFVNHPEPGAKALDR